MTFSPTQWILQPPDAGERFDEALARALNRPPNRHRPWGIVQTIAGATITLGLLPMFIWPKRFWDNTNLEQLQLETFLQWLSRKYCDAKIAAAREALDRARCSRWNRIWVWSIASVVLAIEIFFFAQSGFQWRTLVHMNFARHELGYHALTASLLSFGYFVHHIQIARHSARIKIFVDRLNDLLTASGSEPIPWNPPGLGLRIGWTLAGIIGVLCGAWWAIFATTAGAIQRRYFLRTNLLLRRDLARLVSTPGINSKED
jgi:hypothetical protein